MGVFSVEFLQMFQAATMARKDRLFYNGFIY